LQHAQRILSAALQAGFRESGALNLTSSKAELATPMVGIRSMGLALESLIGYETGGKELCNVPEYQLRTLLEISNERFVENAKRIERFRELLKEFSADGLELGMKKKDQDAEKWEDAEARRERMRADGLERSLALKLSESKGPETEQTVEAPDLDFFDENT
jgi:tRNA wybutosine-synthesizing protein 3